MGRIICVESWGRFSVCFKVFLVMLGYAEPLLLYEEYQLSAKKTEQFIKAVKKLDKRQDEFHDSNLTALAYTSDGDVYHIKTDVGEYSENDIAIEGACYKGTENVVRLLEK